MLLLGGVIATWGACDTIMNDPAYAVDEPGPGIVGNLLGGAGAVVETVLPRPPAPPEETATVDPSPAGTDAVGEPTSVTPEPAGTLAQARATPDSAMRVPPVDLTAAMVPVRRTVGGPAGTGLTRVVEAVAPVTRPVVDAAAPVVRGITGTGLLEPVDAVVGPVADPILETLHPVLAPVLEVTRPILGQPADPAVPPGDPVEPQPGSGGPVPVATTPGATEHPVRVPAVTANRQEATQPPPYWNVAVQRCSGGEPAPAAAADVSSRPGRVGGTGTGGLTPISSGSVTSSAASGAGTAAADISPRPWMPELESQRCASSPCDTFAQRSPQPGTRPA
ncbi:MULTISPECIES: hypothetical protein [Micromonospora]|uniref:Uncharacterized protein n=3 Tax=Micromonospora sicca TaxID=2202420 RepID=A0ABU5JP79_9ACTN|nr:MULTISPECIES: hypothetical protein [unclassified Micromonospora]MBM0224353.1 hypothetical protein [Micromonospora sp. ATA51]MDZ5447452.1 hypothetical protein [Micromonospora sp. 4G57]MDZ5494174.1 hypothetical protein [Micromonospora sp. 4G53]